jgi:hypothetical protein
MGYYLKNAFEYEIRNNIDIEINQLRERDPQLDFTEEETDRIRQLELVRGYLQVRICEMNKKG